MATSADYDWLGQKLVTNGAVKLRVGRKGHSQRSFGKIVVKKDAVRIAEIGVTLLWRRL
jgi:hypothetical protein